MALFSFGMKKKFEELKRCLEEERYEEAVCLADQIPESKAQTAPELNLLGRAYKKTGDFERAKEMFEYSFEVRCTRAVLTDLMDCCLETEDVDGAENYFDEYCRLDPEDKVTQYMYRYRIEKKKGRERHLLISILEELKAMEYMEEYAYELAKQYHKAGMARECMEECRDIISWFGCGSTVERAKALLAYYKGEISLDEIKTAGERYQEEQRRQQEETVVAEPSVDSLPEVGFDLSDTDMEDAEFRENTKEQQADSFELQTEEPVPSQLSALKNFARIKRIRLQIIHSLETALKDKENTYFMITGEEKSGKTTLALDMVKLLYEAGAVRFDRTATINAQQLNQVSFADYGEKLENCNLVIENAGSLSEESLNGLLELTKGHKGSICMFLEDTTRNMNKFLKARGDIDDLFHHRIQLGKYNTEELFGFAYDYIKKEDYSITNTAAEILYNKIDEAVRECAAEQRLCTALEMTDRAVRNAEKRAGEALLHMAAEGRFQQGNYLEVLPEDVEKI